MNDEKLIALLKGIKAKTATDGIAWVKQNQYYEKAVITGAHGETTISFAWGYHDYESYDHELSLNNEAVLDTFSKEHPLVKELAQELVRRIASYHARQTDRLADDLLKEFGIKAAESFDERMEREHPDENLQVGANVFAKLKAEQLMLTLAEASEIYNARLTCSHEDRSVRPGWAPRKHHWIIIGTEKFYIYSNVRENHPFGIFSQTTKEGVDNMHILVRTDDKTIFEFNDGKAVGFVDVKKLEKLLAALSDIVADRPYNQPSLASRFKRGDFE